MKRAGYIILATLILFNLITLFTIGKMSFGPEINGPYSIFSSREFFIAYHIWGIILGGLCIYAIAKKIRILFLITLLLLLLVMFYPIATSSPAKSEGGAAKVDSTLTRP